MEHIDAYFIGNGAFLYMEKRFSKKSNLEDNGRIEDCHNICSIHLSLHRSLYSNIASKTLVYYVSEIQVRGSPVYFSLSVCLLSCRFIK
jgi:hypothetical protein